MLNYKEYGEIQEECYDISKVKNNDYGTETMKRFKEKGLIVRMNDKMERLIQLIWNRKERAVSDEKIEDTAKDLVNYAIYLVMMLRGKLET